MSHAVWVAGPRLRGQSHQLALTTSEDPLLLRTAGGGRILFSAGQHFHIEPAERFEGEFKVRTDGYFYRLRFSDEPVGELVAWHWHPEVRPEPHIHVMGWKLHVPTGRIAFEEVVRMLLGELGVIPARENWQDVLAEMEERFKAFWSWPPVPQAPA